MVRSLLALMLAAVATVVAITLGFVLNKAIRTAKGDARCPVTTVQDQGGAKQSRIQGRTL